MSKYQITFFYSDGFFKKVIVNADSVGKADWIGRNYYPELLKDSERMETETYLEDNNLIEQNNEKQNTGELG
jgi:beta-glucosidase/6-phospho-beta-glucosidase/beta-galactosidase